MPKNAIYSTKSTREFAGFLDSVTEQIDGGATAQAILDSAKNEAGMSLPPMLDKLLGLAKEGDESRILDGVKDGLQIYKSEHGCYPTADLVEASVQQGLAAFYGIRTDGSLILDSASSAHHDQMSLQPNRAVVAILSAIAEAIPFAGYLPVDIGSNQGKLAIVTHQSGSAYGDYALGGIMDGTSSGGVLTSSQRSAKFVVTGAAPYTKAFTQTNLVADPGYCDPAGTGVPVLRGRTIVYVNGLVAATDLPNGSGATSPISGSITIAGVPLTIAGTVTLATGAITITSPTLTGYEVTAQSFIDYEAAPALIPKVSVQATVYDIYANSSRVMTGISMDAAGQFRNELGLDGASEALMAIRTQMAQERHYLALRHAYNLGANNIVNYDFGYAAQIAQKTRAQIWQDFQAHIGNADQNMANNTMDHGITHMYVPGFVAAQMLSLGRDLFEPSGIVARPSIYRVGRLFGKYEIYYDPRVASQNNTNLQTAEIVAVGRSSQPARCPVILGDAVAPTFLDLNMQADLVKNAAMYSRDFTVVNPHQPSAMGAARIKITNFN